MEEVEEGTEETSQKDKEEESMKHYETCPSCSKVLSEAEDTLLAFASIEEATEKGGGEKFLDYATTRVKSTFKERHVEVEAAFQAKKARHEEEKKKGGYDA